jgi:hypothetical protein
MRGSAYRAGPLANLSAVIPGRLAEPSYDVQLHIGESRDSGFVLCTPRNDVEIYSPTIFSSNAISASGAVTFAEWLASIS